jgi:hypothetical protein
LEVGVSIRDNRGRPRMSQISLRDQKATNENRLLIIGKAFLTGVPQASPTVLGPRAKSSILSKKSPERPEHLKREAAASFEPSTAARHCSSDCGNLELEPVLIFKFDFCLIEHGGFTQLAFLC